MMDDVGIGPDPAFVASQSSRVSPSRPKASIGGMSADQFKARFPRWEHLSFDYGRWTATHENYDVSYEGDEDGWVDNGLMCEGRTLEELADEIEAKEADLAGDA